MFILGAEDRVNNLLLHFETKAIYYYFLFELACERRRNSPAYS